VEQFNLGSLPAAQSNYVKTSPQAGKNLYKNILNKAGGGNRTHNNSLEGYGFTTKLRPQWRTI
jgi:hypothetical protein